jgi:ankyrin repeat protein
LLACANGHLGIVELLLGREDADVNAQTKEWGSTALIISARDGQSKILKQLLKHKDIDFNAKDNEGKTAFMFACRGGNKENIRLFLETAGVDFDAKDKRGRIALMYACESLHLDVVNDWLLWKPDDIRAVDNEGMTCLMLACRAGNKKMVQALLDEKGVKSNTKIKMGRHH